MTQQEKIEEIVRTFFQEFTIKTIEGKNVDITDSKMVKRAMLDHYENIFPTFAKEVPQKIMRITYEEESEAEKGLTMTFKKTNIDPLELLQFSCRHDHLYQAMINEYKRCFTILLNGKLPK